MSSRIKNMPQDSLKSAVFRSFVRCDDPKGVVECGTIRRYKIGSKKLESNTVESQRLPNNLKESAYNKEKAKDGNNNIASEESDNPSLHLMEVSRGAQKLKPAVDSWYKRMSFVEQCKDIPKDKLKGTTDQQDSVIMLGKLQEASQYMALPKRNKDKDRGVKADNLGMIISRSNYNQFEDHNCQMEFQKPRVSGDGSSEDCYEELRNVIRESFTRQNLLQKSSFKEKVGVDSIMYESVVYPSDLTPPDSFLSSKNPIEKQNGPGLIAKLMGLEEFPPKTYLSTPPKQLEGGKIFKPRKPTFDIDLPKGRKPQFSTQKVNRERRSLKEIIETMQCKGLLKTSKSQIYPCNDTHLEKMLTCKSPPIVVIKPLHLRRLKYEELRRCTFVDMERDLHCSEAVCTKQKTRGEILSKTINHPKAPLNSECRNAQFEDSPIKRHRQEKEVNCRELLIKSDGKDVNNNLKPFSNKTKTFIPANHRPKKVEEKKVDEIQKVIPGRRKRVHTENVKPKGDSKSHDHNKVTSTKLRNPENGSNISENGMVHKRHATSNSISKGNKPNTSQNSCDQSRSARKEKSVQKKVPENVEKSGLKDDNCQTDLPRANDSDLSISNVVKLHSEEASCASEILFEEKCNNRLCFPSEADMLTTLHESSTRPMEEPSCCVYGKINERSCYETTNTKRLLLQTPLFHSRVAELFGTVSYQCLFWQTKNWPDSETANTKLLLDCANELLECRSLTCTPPIHPFLGSLVKMPRIFVSFDRLVAEVCCGIEDLQNYSKLPNDSVPMDALQALLARDLSCQWLGRGVWEMCWRDGFNVDEVEQIVGELEHLILSELTEELLMEFALKCL